MIRHTVIYFAILLITTLFVGCHKQPQKVRHLSDGKEVDSAIMAQLQFNTQMADAADKHCSDFILTDSIKYAMSDYGFWYAKTIKNISDTIQHGQEISLHIQISEVGGELISDVKHHHIVGSGELPIAITHSLKLMCVGEQMRIVAPWYTAYGVEGTSIIKPYSNLLIIITIEE